MSPPFTVEQKQDIVIHRFITSEDEAVDLWSTAFTSLANSTPEAEWFRVLVDVAGPNISFTSHARATTRTLFTQYGKRKGRVAFLFAWRTSPYLARIFFAGLGKLELQINYFSDEASAIQWLKSGE